MEVLRMHYRFYENVLYKSTTYLLTYLLTYIFADNLEHSLLVISATGYLSRANILKMQHGLNNLKLKLITLITLIETLNLAVVS